MYLCDLVIESAVLSFIKSSCLSKMIILGVLPEGTSHLEYGPIRKRRDQSWPCWLPLLDGCAARQPIEPFKRCFPHASYTRRVRYLSMFEAALLRQAKVLLSLRCSCGFHDIFRWLKFMGLGALNQRVKGRYIRVTNDIRFR